MRFVAVDTETAPIPERSFVPRRGAGASDAGEPARAARIYTGPFVAPELVLGSMYPPMMFVPAPGERGLVLDRDALLRSLKFLLSEEHTVWANIGFDYLVLTAALPELDALFLRAAGEGRLHDVQLLDLLYGLSVGRYDMPQYKDGAWSTPRMQRRSLEVLAREYCGLELEKDPEVRLGFGQFAGRPIAELPERFRRYAAQDAWATYRVFEKLLELTGGELLSEPMQVRAVLVCAHMDQRGLAIDRAEAARLRKQFAGGLLPLQKELVRVGLGCWTNAVRAKRMTFIGWPSEKIGAIEPGWELSEDYDTPTVTKIIAYKKHYALLTAPAKFTLRTGALRSRLGELQVDDVPITEKTGLLAAEAEFWREHVPEEAADLQAWLEYEKLLKVLTTYLDLYASVDEVYARWHVLGARSGRMSASLPNVQNVPKTRYGIRSLFVARPGHVFVRGDFSAQELFTLCEYMLSVGIKGGLYDAVTSGEDLHCYGASRVLGRPVDKKDPARQGFKALAFGVPGGLGPAKLARYAHRSFGVRWTVEEARAARERFLSIFTDVREYLDRFKTGQDMLLRRYTGQGVREWASRLGCPGEWNVAKVMLRSPDPAVRQAGEEVERSQEITLPTGRKRSRCRFTEAANTGFQGLASDVTKEAAWYAHRAGLRVMLLVHDEIVIECPQKDITPAFVGSELKRVMLEAFHEVCPRVGGHARVEVSVSDRWGKATNAEGKEV